MCPICVVHLNKVSTVLEKYKKIPGGAKLQEIFGGALRYNFFWQKNGKKNTGGPKSKFGRVGYAKQDIFRLKVA